MNDISKISMMCSFIGHLILSGNVSAIKFLYGTAWREHPALIKTIDELQRHLTTAEILGDTRGIYGMEFLYHWCQRQFEIVRKRRRNFVVFRRKGG